MVERVAKLLRRRTREQGVLRSIPGTGRVYKPLGKLWIYITKKYVQGDERNYVIWN
jgi:hypothetical protein